MPMVTLFLINVAHEVQGDSLLGSCIGESYWVLDVVPDNLPS